jgi:hypothetical protein
MFKAAQNGLILGFQASFFISWNLPATASIPALCLLTPYLGNGICCRELVVFNKDLHLIPSWNTLPLRITDPVFHLSAKEENQ